MLAAALAFLGPRLARERQSDIVPNNDVIPDSHKNPAEPPDSASP
jgi:hypothetical protein